MSIQKLLRTFRTSLTASRDDFTLEEEVTLYRKRADVALSEERFNDALVFLAKILRLNPYDLSARMTVAETYHRQLLEPTKALLTYEKVIATAGYDESNPFCAAAREGIRELSATESPVPVLSLGDDVDDSASETQDELLAAEGGAR
jgi:tetratricopeptide (TPR) repeat protein